MGVCERPHQVMQVATLLLASVALVSSDFIGGTGHVHDHQPENGLARSGRQEEGAVQGGVDFSGCQTDPETGLCCVERQEEVSEENFEKSCQITFKQQAFNETVRKCYRPTEKVCNGQGPEECRTVYESSCTTKYVEKQPGKFVG